MESNNLKLLLVDDEEAFVRALALNLQELYGYSTTPALSGKEAVGLLEKSSTGFDVILLDYRMPEMNGLNVLQWMLEQKNTTPVIMLTAAGSEQVAVEALKLGAYDYIRKEQIDVEHLDIVIRGTHERHLYRVAESIDRERFKEIAMNDYASGLVRLIVNSVTPTLNNSLSQLAVDVEKGSKQLTRLPKTKKRALKELLDDIQTQSRTVETVTKGLLRLYELLYAHHTEIPDIENVKHWFNHELRINQSK